MALEKKSGMYVFRLRKISGLSQTYFAEKIGCTRGYISQLEGDKVDISLSTFIEWTKLFEIKDVSEIFDNKKYEKHLTK